MASCCPKIPTLVYRFHFCTDIVFLTMSGGKKLLSVFYFIVQLAIYAFSTNPGILSSFMKHLLGENGKNHLLALYSLVQKINY